MSIQIKDLCRMFTGTLSGICRFIGRLGRRMVRIIYERKGSEAKVELVAQQQLQKPPGFSIHGIVRKKKDKTT